MRKLDLSPWGQQVRTSFTYHMGSSSTSAVGALAPIAPINFVIGCTAFFLMERGKQLRTTFTYRRGIGSKSAAGAIAPIIFVQRVRCISPDRKLT